MDKYGEAHEKARAEYEKARKQGYTWLMGLLEGMFPELKESEDERIRKAIMEVLKRVSGATDVLENQDTTFKKAMIWLEKQKDKRELDFAEGKVEGVKQTCQEIKDAMSLFEPKDLTPFEFTFRDYIDSAIRYCLSGEGYQQYIKEWAADLLNLEKRKEYPTNEEMLRTLRVEYEKGVADTIAKYEQKNQKPAEWSKNDSRILYNVISYLGYAAGQRGVRDDEFKEANSWLKSLPNGFIVNPNYNEDMVNLLVAELQSIADCNGVPRQYDAEISWLKSLRPQPKQEWSEEDEKMRGTCIYLLAHDEVIGPWKDCIAWLKSLRPPQYCENCKLKRSVENWKPSEEQMNALYDILHPADPVNMDAVKSLYNDLQKLL